MRAVSRGPFSRWQQSQPEAKHWAQSVSGAGMDTVLAKQQTDAKNKVFLSRRLRYDKFNEVKIKHDILVISERIKSTPVNQTELLISEYRRMKRKLRFLEMIRILRSCIN